jgi:FkbM family methyltransferase
MVFKRLKQRYRHRQLRTHGIVVDVELISVAYGARSGIWTIFPDVLLPGSVVYSFGVGNNIEWDLGMIRNHGVELYAFDPTPRSVEWIDQQSLPDEFHFHPIGLSNNDGEQNFYAPTREHKFNFSYYRRRKRDAKIVSCTVNRLGTLLAMFGHKTIDVLKMDIEGGEMDALPDILSTEHGIGQLLVEFHYNDPNISFKQFSTIISSLRKRGFRIFHISERGYEFSFIHQSLLE